MTNQTDSTAIDTTNPPVALLIGIEDYPAFEGKRNLYAGRNDVLAYWKVCRRLGYEPQNIYVLTTPELDRTSIIEAEVELGPELYPDESANDIRRRAEAWFSSEDDRSHVVCTTATRENILVYADVLFSKIADFRADGATFEIRGSHGFLAYSGHGARINGQLALCPSDIQANLKGAIDLAQLGDAIRKACKDMQKDEAALGRNLTIVLDCCFAADRPNQQNSSQRLATLTPEVLAEGERRIPEIASRVFCASGPGEQSYQAMLGGYWYSAFTWAFTVALEQWKIHEGSSSHSTISHNELLFRTRMLLKALSFRQHPMLVGKFGLSNEPVFGDYYRRGTMVTSLQPNAERLKGQLQPDYKYTITEKFGDGSELDVAVVIVTYDNNAPVEKWYLNKSNMAQISKAVSLLIKTESYKSGDPLPTGYGDPKIVNAGTDTDWQKATQSNATSTEADYYFGRAMVDKNIVCLRLKVDAAGIVNGVAWYSYNRLTTRLVLGTVGTERQQWSLKTSASAPSPATIESKYYCLKSW